MANKTYALSVVRNGHPDSGINIGLASPSAIGGMVTDILTGETEIEFEDDAILPDELTIIVRVANDVPQEPDGSGVVASGPTPEEEERG